MVIEQQKREKLAQSTLNDSSLFNSPVPYLVLQQLLIKPATRRVAGRSPAIGFIFLFVAGLKAKFTL